MLCGYRFIRLACIFARETGSAHLSSAAQAFVQLPTTGQRPSNSVFQVISESAVCSGDIPDHPTARILQEEVSESPADMPEGMSTRQVAEAAHVSETRMARLFTCLHAA